MGASTLMKIVAFEHWRWIGSPAWRIVHTTYVQVVFPEKALLGRSYSTSRLLKTRHVPSPEGGPSVSVTLNARLDKSFSVTGKVAEGTLLPMMYWGLDPTLVTWRSRLPFPGSRIHVPSPKGVHPAERHAFLSLSKALHPVVPLAIHLPDPPGRVTKRQRGLMVQRLDEKSRSSHLSSSSIRGGSSIALIKGNKTFVGLSVGDVVGNIVGNNVGDKVGKVGDRVGEKDLLSNGKKRGRWREACEI